MDNATDREAWAFHLRQLRSVLMTEERDNPLARLTFKLAGALGRSRRLCILAVGRSALARSGVRRYEETLAQVDAMYEEEARDERAALVEEIARRNRGLEARQRENEGRAALAPDQLLWLARQVAITDGHDMSAGERLTWLQEQARAALAAATK